MIPNRMMRWFLNTFFYLLYQPFSWSYDLVAAVVSLGYWKTWVYSIFPYLAGPRILELGHGPGHLLALIEKRGIQGFGLDRSPQMSRQAFRRISRLSPAWHPKLVLGQGEHLPYAGSTFQTVAATFPTRYITQADTLNEVHRILVPEGRLVLLLSAWITGNSPAERALRLLYNITGETPNLKEEQVQTLTNLFSEAGFRVEIKWLEQKIGTLLLVLATKSSKPGEQVVIND
jgi:ubiquinone/menaquinone biosynthesis C-methylase UbiE